MLFVLARQEKIRTHPGVIIGTFLTGYGLSRSTVEFFREPDIQLGFILPGVTMGQILSLPMILVGLWLIRHALARPAERAGR